MNIPFVDLKAQYQTIKSEIDGAIEQVISETAFISGGYAKRFEEGFQNFSNLKHVVACANGTDSLEILLKARGIGAGDEVIVPAVSWISTSEAVSAVGATPVFVDITPGNYTIDPKLIEEKITSKTKAIIPVHLYGNPADMKEIMAIANKHDLFVLEDCAQAHGAEIDGQIIGTFGDSASFSFYPGKNLGAYGDAGAMATNDEELARVCRMIANHGQTAKHKHLIEGRNSRMDGLQAAILSVKLKYLNEWTNKRIANAKIYDEFLRDSVVQTPQRNANYKHVFHLYVIQSENRDELKNYLESRGIETAIHYPTPLPLLDAYEARGFRREDFPVAAGFTGKILSLPMYAELTPEMIKYVSDSIIQFSEKKATV